MNFFSSTVTTLTARFFSILFGVLTGVLTARALGPEGRGILAVVVSTVSIGVTFGMIGLAEANTYLMARDRKLSERLTANSIWIALVVGILVGAIIVAVYMVSPAVFESIPFDALLVGLMSVPFVILGLLVQRLYLGQNRIVMFNAYELTTRSLVLIATFIVLYLLHQPLWLYFLTYGAVFAFSSILFCARQEISVSSAIRVDVGLLRSALAYGYRPYIATLLPFLFSRIGLYFVNSMVGAEDAGYYSVAMQANDLFLIVPGVIGQLLFPRVSADNSDSKLTLKAFRFTLVLMLPLFVVGQLFAPEIIMILFGAEFMPAVPMMRVLFVGGFLSGLGLILSHDLAGRGYPLFMVLLWLPLNVANVIFNIVLIPHWGAVGTAASAAATFLIGFVSIVIYFRSYVRIDSWSPFVPHGSDFRDLVQAIRASLSQLRHHRES